MMYSEIDEKQTIKNVKHFFDNDVQRIRQKASFEKYPVKSNHDDNTKVRTSVYRGDGALIGTMNAVDRWEEIQRAIQALPTIERKVLYGRYVDNLSWNSISEKMGYSVRRLQEIINQAAVNFSFIYADVVDLQIKVGEDGGQV